MFTLKFYSADNNEGLWKVVACQSYSVLYPAGMKDVSVVTYPGPTDQDGTEFYITPDVGDYDVCYVENAQGKTIDRIRPQGAA